MAIVLSTRIQHLIAAAAAGVVLCLWAGGASAAGPETPPARAALERGEEALRSLDYNRALTELDSAVANNDLEPPERAVALLNRGLARQNLRDNQGSIADYSESIQIGTLPAAARAIAYFNRGLAQNAVGQTTLALEDLSTAIKINPAFAQAYNSRGTLMRSLGRHEQAVRDYQAAIKNRYPQPHLAYYGAALSYAEMRQIAQARTSLRKAIDANPNFNMARDKLAEIDATITPVNDTPSRMVEADPTTTQSIGGQSDADSGETLAGTDVDRQAVDSGRSRSDGYVVQLMAQRDKEALVKAWSALSRKHSTVLDGLDPIYQKADLGTKGVVYRLRTGPFAARGEAERICNALKRRGAACFTAMSN
jgi:tetratricopeptide (TPR) repeat protein